MPPTGSEPVVRNVIPDLPGVNIPRFVASERFQAKWPFAVPNCTGPNRFLGDGEDLGLSVTLGGK